MCLSYVCVCVCVCVVSGSLSLAHGGICTIFDLGCASRPLKRSLIQSTSISAHLLCHTHTHTLSLSLFLYLSSRRLLFVKRETYGIAETEDLYYQTVTVGLEQDSVFSVGSIVHVYWPYY